MKRVIGAMAGLAVAVAATVVAPTVTDAVLPVYSFPTLQLQQTILTNPFIGAPTLHPGDVEGLAYDPTRNTMWIADDSKQRLNELDMATGALLTTITQSQMATTPALVLGGPEAGLTRPADLEAMAYDAVHDVLYAFAGPCCAAVHHDPTVFRLVRPAPGASFQPESYQPLETLTYQGILLNDLSGAGAYNGQLWVGYKKKIYQYDYATNTILTGLNVPTVTGSITGMGFSPVGANAPGPDDLWITTSSGSILYRFTWPALTLVPNHVIQMKDLGLLDTRAVEVVNNTLVLADGYDFYPPNTPSEFALRVYGLAQNPPTAAFTTVPTTLTGGAPFAVAFTDTSIDRPLSWSWDFGDSTPLVTTKNAAHTYTVPGTYTVTHSATNPNGTTTATTTVVVTGAPAAAFTNSVPTGAAPQIVNFTDQSTAASPITSWAWDFGDGSPIDTTRHPSHTFLVGGTFNVSLTVTNLDGSSSVSRQVIVYSAPDASFTTDVVSGFAPLNVSFTNTSGGTHTPTTTWTWDFGDGKPAENLQDPAHVYSVAGTYTVTLTVNNGYGVDSATRVITVNSAPVAAFSSSVLTGAAPLVVTFTDESVAVPAITGWSWNFDDGAATSTAQHPSHTFMAPGVYAVRLSVVSPLGHAQVTHLVTVTGPPVAAYTSNVTTGVVPLTVQFTDASVGTPNVTGWSWNFGDGTASSAAENPSHTFTAPGIYTVALTATNSSGSGVVSHTIVVTLPPVASFSSSATTGAAPLGATFTNTSTGSPAPTLSWSFGDGTPGSSAANPAHTFAAPGVYTVTLTATSAAGTSTTTRQVTVTGPPVASLTTNVATGTAPLSVSFTNTSTGTPTPTSWSWNFGDGTPVAAGANQTHIFTTPGTYTVALTTTNAAGSTTVTRSITVNSVGSYVGLTPTRLLDTRPASTVDGRFRALGPLGAGGGAQFPVLGRGEIPAFGVGSVVLNVTAIGPTASSYLTVWPAGGTRPDASNLNYAAGQTFPNMVIVPLGANGEIEMINAAGAVDVAVDVLGYFPATSTFVGLNPKRLMDTRVGGATADQLFETRSRVGEGAVVSVTVAGRGGVPSAGGGSVALNITAVEASAGSYMTVWPTGQPMPTASNLNYQAGQTIPNMVIVPLGANGKVSLFNASGTVDVLVDVLGWFPNDAGFTGLGPARLMDTRGGTTVDGRFAGSGPIADDRFVDVAVLGRGGVPMTGVGSVALNVTAVGPTAESYMTVWPAGRTMPTASNLNYVAGDVFPNMVIVPIDANGRISLYNAVGSTDVIVDVLGWFPL